MKKSRVVMVMAVAIIAIVAVMGVSYASWSVTKGDVDAGSVQIAAPTVMTTSQTSVDNTDKVLAPLGTVVGNGKTVVQEMTLTNVTATLADGGNATIKVWAEVKVDGVANTALVVELDDTAISLVSTTLTDVGAALNNVALTVALPADADAATYAGKTISIILHFSI